MFEQKRQKKYMWLVELMVMEINESFQFPMIEIIPRMVHIQNLSNRNL